MTERIVIAGASGFMGGYLRRQFTESGADVRTVGRKGADAAWNDPAAITALVNGADLVLNLAGKSVNCRYTERNRAEIFRSRIETTTALGRAIARAETPPALWINSSTATIYRHADDRPQTDEDGELGEGFSVDVARSWEHAFIDHAVAGTRQVAIRTSIVLGDGSALTPLTNLTRFGLGGPQLGGRSGLGRQMFSWIHIDDVWRAIRFLQSHADVAGTVNLASPNPVQNRELMRTLRTALGVSIGLPAFEWMLRLGAGIIGTDPELVLKSRWVLPTRLESLGFEFAHPLLAGAIADILAEKRSTAAGTRAR